MVGNFPPITTINANICTKKTPSGKIWPPKWKELEWMDLIQIYTWEKVKKQARKKYLKWKSRYQNGFYYIF